MATRTRKNRTPKQDETPITPDETPVTPNPEPETPVTPVLTLTQLDTDAPVGNLPVPTVTPETPITPEPLTDTQVRNLEREYQDYLVKLDRANFLVDKSVRCIQKAIVDTAKKNTEREEGKPLYTVHMIAYYLHHARMLPKHQITRTSILERMVEIKKSLETK